LVDDWFDSSELSYVWWEGEVFYFLFLAGEVYLFKGANIFIKPSSRYNVESYGGKHAIEKTMKNYYISNGCFICAIILLGYEFKKPTSLNLNFRAKA
jgi:hypothetical protein